MTTTIAPQSGEEAPLLSETPPPAQKQRLIYLDNLKIVLIMGVIACHATLIYGPGTGWLGLHEGHPGILETLILGIPGMIGGLFWLGVFFLIAGMFVPKSLQRKGALKFSQERIIHLGIPLAVYVIVVMPLLKYATARSLDQTVESPWSWSAAHITPLDAGPLWFVAALMVFSVAYAVYDRVWPGRPKGDAVITVRGLIFLGIAIAVGSFVFRLEWPIYSGQILGLHLWQWPQFVLLFWAGAWAAERGWPTLSDRVWHWCGYAVLISAVSGALLVLCVYYGLLPRDPGLYSGGWHWEAIFAPIIEGALAVGGSMWLLGFFRRHVGSLFPMGNQLIRSYYAAYVIQAPVVIGLALALHGAVFSSELKFLIVAPLGIVLSFVAACYLVKLPGVNKIL